MYLDGSAPQLPSKVQSWVGAGQCGVQNCARQGRAAPPRRPASRDVPPRLGAHGLVCFGTHPMWHQLTQKKKKSSFLSLPSGYSLSELLMAGDFQPRKMATAFHGKSRTSPM